MSTATLQFDSDRRERLSGMLGASIVFHALLFASALASTLLGRHSGGSWGQNWGSDNTARVNAVSSLPAVPLPAPLLATRSTVATENPGLYKSEPIKPEPVPTKADIQIPKFKDTVKVEKAERINKRIQKEPLDAPDNAIPFGVGGKPAMTYQQFSNAAGTGNIEFGQGNFGDRYNLYVQGVKTRISSNWLLSTISPGIVTAPRVYLEFDILRDGTISSPQITQSSGVPEVDRSALRAVLASNPLAPLPRDYSGGQVSVKFYFDFHR